MALKINTPVNRNGMFYDEMEFQMECDIMESYIMDDLHQTVVLFEVDRTKTNVHAIYHENLDGTVRYKAPKELPCTYEIKDAQTKSYDTQSNNGVYMLSGNLSVTIMTSTLQKFKCDIHRGDYLGVLVDNNRMAYFVVTNDGRVNTSNNMFIGAYKPAYRVITATPCPTEEFKGE